VRADNDPTFGLRGALVTPKVQHRAAITNKEVFKGLTKSVWAYKNDPSTISALKLIARLALQPETNKKEANR